MVLFEPKQSVGEEEVAHLVAVEIKDFCIPVLVFSHAWISVLVQVRAIEICQSVGITRKMGRHPIDDDTDVILVAVINKILKILGCSKTRGGCKIAQNLISPRSIKWVLRHWEKLDVGISHLFYIFHELMG